MVRGDSLINWDMALNKYVILPWGGENKHKIQIRMEAFNAFNQTSFATLSSIIRHGPLRSSNLAHPGC